MRRAPFSRLASSGVAASPEGRPSPPLVEISPKRRSLSYSQLTELWEFREVLWAFALRAVKVKYKQAAIGIGWALVQPILAALIFALIFGRVAKLPTDNGTPYLLFVLAGMTCWSYVNTAIATSSESVVTDQTLLRKVYFPREVIPFGAIAAALVDFGPALLVLLVVAAAFGEWPAVSWIVLPVLVLMLVAAASAVGLVLSALNVYYRDVRYTVPFILQLGLFGSAVVFPLSLLGDPWTTIYGIANPVAGAIDGVRDVVTVGAWPDAVVTAGGLAWALFLVVVAYALFKRLERSFGDRV